MTLTEDPKGWALFVAASLATCRFCGVSGAAPLGELCPEGDGSDFHDFEPCDEEAAPLAPSAVSSSGGSVPVRLLHANPSLREAACDLPPVARTGLPSVDEGDV